MLAATPIAVYPEKTPRFTETLGEREMIELFYNELDGWAGDVFGFEWLGRDGFAREDCE